MVLSLYRRPAPERRSIMGFSSWLRHRTSSRAPRGRTPHRPTAARFRPRLEALEDRAVPAQVSLTVNSLADTVDTNPNVTSLREAILAADAGSPSDKFTIGFAVTGTIDLQSPLPDLNNTIAIQGPGASSLTVERAAGFSFASAIVTVDASQTASLSGLTITNGNAGGVVNNGTLTVVNSAVVNNPDAIFFGAGGGILNTGTLTVSGSTVAGNSAGFGGGIMNTSSGLGATLTVTDSTVAGNSAQLVVGGIYNGTGCTLPVPGSMVSGNTAVDPAGIWTVLGTLTVDRSMVSGNTATGNGHVPGEGGGILNDGTMTVSGSTLSGNAADLGGGIYSDGFPTTVRNCVFTGNSATRGGGIYFGSAN